MEPLIKYDKETEEFEFGHDHGLHDATAPGGRIGPALPGWSDDYLVGYCSGVIEGLTGGRLAL